MEPAPDATVRLIADAVEDLGEGIGSVFSIGLSEDAEPDDASFSLIFSITEPDSVGDGYSVVAEPGQRCAYRSVTRCELAEPTLLLQFTDEAAEGLKLPSALRLELDVTEEQIATLRRGLRRVGLDLTVEHQ